MWYVAHWPGQHAAFGQILFGRDALYSFRYRSCLPLSLGSHLPGDVEAKRRADSRVHAFLYGHFVRGLYLRAEETRVRLEKLKGQSGSSVIKFGTSGWRGLIARDFTFDNVRLVTQAIAEYLTSHRPAGTTATATASNVVIMAYDTRFLGREFSLASAEVLAANGISPLLCNRDSPTPVVAHNIRARKALGGINMTASHNPAEYQGLKFSTSNGAPAPPEVTKQLEANVARLQQQNWTFKASVVGTYECKTFDPQPAYFKQIHRLVDFAAIKRARLKVAVELMYGTGHGYLDTL